jgi:hypothetical protein
MKKANTPGQELLAQFHRVPLDEPEPCLDCGREALGGLYLAGEIRPLCIADHTHLAESAHGRRLDEALQSINALGQGTPRARVAELHNFAARHLADWLDMRQAERRNGMPQADPLA